MDMGLTSHVYRIPNWILESEKVVLTILCNNRGFEGNNRSYLVNPNLLLAYLFLREYDEYI